MLTLASEALILVSGIALAAILLPAIWGVLVYNRFVATRQHMKESWADIDVELKRRHDLIPSLVATVRGYMEHERELFERIAALRAKAIEAHPNASAQATDETALQLGLRHLFALSERYPDLKASSQFTTLQHELALTEDRIAAARRFYNANVRDLNRLAMSFPTNLIATIFGFKPGSFFELSSEAERVVPRAALSSMTQPAPDTIH
jgi:LemA protein